MVKSIGWPERLLLGCLPLSVLLFIPALGNAFLLKHPITALGISAALLVLFWNGTRPLQALPPALLTIGSVYWGTAAVGSILAQNPGQAGQDLLLLVLFLDLFFTIAAGGFTRDLPRQAAWVVSFSVLGVSLLGIPQAVFPGFLDFGLQALGKMKTFSTLGNPNYVGCFLVLALPLCAQLFLEQKGPRRVFLAVTGLAGLACLWLTQSRSAWLAFLFCLGLALFLKFPKPAMRRMLGVGLLLLTAAALYAGTATHTGRGRLLIWREAISIWATHPLLGVGLGNFNNHQLAAQERVLADPEMRDKFIHNAAFIYDAHNELLNQLAETGLVGCVLWMTLMVWVARKGWAVARRPGLGRAWALGIGGMLFYGLWNTALFYAPLGLCFWVGAGILFFLEPAAPRTKGRTFPRVAWAAVFCLVLVSSAWIFCLVQAGRLEHRGDLLLETGPFDRATATFREAVRWNPWDGYLHEKLALSLYFEGRMQEALGPLERAGRLYGDVGVPYLKAEILAKSGRYEEAAILFREIGKAFPNHVTPPFMLGQILRKLGRVEEAKAEFKRVLDTPESTTNLKLDRGKVRKQKELAKEMLVGLDGDR